MVLHSAEVQRVGQRLVVGQGLGGRAPVHIWRPAQHGDRETRAGVRGGGWPAFSHQAHVALGSVGMQARVCVAACQTECVQYRCVQERVYVFFFRIVTTMRSALVERRPKVGKHLPNGSIIPFNQNHYTTFSQYLNLIKVIIKKRVCSNLI